MLLFGCNPVLAAAVAAAVVTPLAPGIVPVAPENRLSCTYSYSRPTLRAPEISLVDVLPEADGKFLNALDVGCAESAG